MIDLAVITALRTPLRIPAHARPPPLEGAGAAVHGLLHGHPRFRDRGRGAALDRRGPGVLGRGSAVGAERLPAQLRRSAAAGRARRRPAGAPPDVHRRHRPVRAGLARRRTGGHERGAAHRARRAGRGGRDHDPDRAVDRDDDLPGGRRAQQGARDLGLDRRHRRDRGVAGRRPDHRRPRLGVDLLHQRARRRRGGRAQPGAPAREPRGGRAAALRRRRRGDDHGRAGGAGLRGRRGPGGRLGRRARRWACWRWRRS